MSTFSGIEMSKRALNAHSKSLQIVGHNINNINTEGYSKQRVDLKTMIPLHIPGLRPEIPGQIGQGVEQSQIIRQRNLGLDNQIFSQGHKEAYWDTRNAYMSRLESMYNEVGESSIRNMLDRYWESWQEVATNPEEGAARTVLLERADTLISGIRDRYSQLTDMRTMLDDEVVYTANLINQYTKDISTLNHKIYESQSLGDSPNDWLDRRDLLVEKLGKLVNITVDRNDPNEFLVHTNGKVLVQGDEFRTFEIVKNADDVNTHTVRWADTGEEVDYTGGSLASLIDLRDEDVRGELQKLNTFSIVLTDETNNLHTQGYSLTGERGRNFFVETPAVINAQGNLDVTQDGTFDESRIYRLTGKNELHKNSIIGVSGEITLQGTTAEETIIVAYNATDTVQQVIDRMNGSGAEINASLDSNNRITIHANTSHDNNNPDFVLRVLEDSGEFLSGYSGLLSTLGGDGGFNWKQANAVDVLVEGTSYGVAPYLDPAASMTVNAFVRKQPQEIAVSVLAQDGVVDVGDGAIGLKIANLRINDVGLGEAKSFDDYFAESVASVASRGEEAEIRSKTYSLIMDQLREERSSVSGVSLDEELQDMIKFQTAYGAAAKFLTNLNQTFETLLNMV